MASETSSAAKRARPLSPHLQVYKPQITSVLSISHRATGVALSAGTLLLAAWIVATAMGPGAHARVAAFAGSWLGQLMLLGWSVALFYHLLNGIRHLFWDAGLGLSVTTSFRSGVMSMAFSVVATVIVWAIGLGSGAP